MAYTIGELAKRSGVTVRSLHHYDEFGLLKPSGRSDSGYRLYTDADVTRLLRILAYRQMGLALKDVLRLLNSESLSLQQVLDQQINATRQQISRQQRLLDRLQYLSRRASGPDGVDADELLQAMTIMNKLDEYLDADQQQQLDRIRQSMDEGQLEAVRANWAELIPAVRAELAKGSDPTSEPVQQLAIRWMQLLRQFTNGDLQMIQKIGSMYQQEPGLQKLTGIDRELLDFIGRAFAVCAEKRELWDIDLPASPTDQPAPEK
ncbi:MerR family transcriptional regulator [Permianibacter sp. IMCC34836]|uniref:MerR family transcriptional regulator n=1 Tax=Permianibacter fluminis TaxID=2738515 RepID=UPI001557D1D3|nr:MerR family transcriptional regulator [Permianibacter fluminis]NQD35865.1 MerR family transcriptional regulator [Permianibacter fluminis]